jgi:hypothetical protein
MVEIVAVGIVRTHWSGTSGGPGITQLAVREGAGAFWTSTQAQNAVNAVRAFWNTMIPQLPDNIQLNVNPVVDIYNEVDGELQASVTAPTAPAVVIGGSAAAFQMPAGMKLNLNTGIIRNGRRVRGSIFIVPASSFTTTDGVVLGTVRTSTNTAAATMLSSLATSGLELSVWSREAIKDGVTRPGAISKVSAIETNEKVAILRGRRD